MFLISRLFLILRLILLVLFAALPLTLSSCKRSTTEKAADKTVLIRVVHSPEVQSYLNSVVEGFHLANPTLPDGSDVRVELKQEAGITAAERISKGRLKTHAWLASSSALVNYTNISLQNLGPAQVDCQQIFATPIIAAVQSRQLKAFNATDSEFSWSDFIDTHSALEKKEGADIKVTLSHASPTSSSTGLPSLLQIAYLALPQEGALNLAELKVPENFEKIRALQGLVSHYGFSEGALLNTAALSRAEKPLISFTTEQQVALFNARAMSNNPGSSPPLTALYPKEGSFWVDYQLCVSDADWVTPAHRAAVKLFASALLSENAQLAAERRGFRPSVAGIPSAAPLTREFGVEVSKGSKAFLPPPGELISFLLERWSDLQRPKALLLALDTSGSMEGAALRIGKKHFRNILAACSWKDLKGILSFSTRPTVQAEFTTDSAEVIPALDQLQAVGGSAVYDSIRKGVEMLNTLKVSTYRKTLLVFTDGEDKNSDTSLKTLLPIVEDAFRSANLNLIIVGVGHDADFSDLKRIAEAANGLFFQGGLDDMDELFEQLILNL